MTEKQLRLLAIDIAEKRVFGTWQMNEDEMKFLKFVFTPFIFIGEKQRQEMTDNEIIHFFEYYREAGPMAINGLPTFLTMLHITKTDWEKVVRYIEEYKARVKSFLKTKEKEPEGPTLFDGVNNEQNS